MARFPVDKPYTITQGFGMTPYAKTGAYGGGPHTGVDIAKHLDATIYQPVPVVDEIKGWDSEGYGHYWVGTTAKGDEIFLAHMHKHGSGNIVGYMGTSGYSSGVHTHFEVRRNGRAIDPIKWLNEQRKVGNVTTAEANKLKKQIAACRKERTLFAKGYTILKYQDRLGRVPSAKEIALRIDFPHAKLKKALEANGPERQRFIADTGRKSAFLTKKELVKLKNA